MFSKTLRMTALALLLAPLVNTGAGAAEAAAADPAAIVERADRIRFPLEGFQVDVKITSTSPGRDPDVRDYRVLAKGHDDSLVMTMSPASERGTIMLMKAADLWVFVPQVSQPVRLPLSQRLTGQVANGDLARANFAGDYTAVLSGIENIDGADHHVLDLTASRKGVTYQKVRYWVAAKDFRPYKSEFYTLSNRLMKTAYYQEFKELGGAVRPTRMIMEDALKKGDQSVMEYRDMQVRDLPDKVFTKEYLKKLQ